MGNGKYDIFNPNVFAAIPCGVKVLDVGCASGRLGKRLRVEKAPEFLAGVEIERSAAEEAKKVYDKVVVADLEDLDGLPFARNFFDVIVCADVLEHPKDPTSVLRFLTSYLSEEGFFLISVPNVVFASVRLALLFGRFDYNPAGGILDENHLRFFTRRGLTFTDPFCDSIFSQGRERC